LLMEKDITVAIERFERKVAEREKQAMDQQQMAMQQQQAAAQEQQSIQAQMEMQKEQMIQQGKESLENIRGGYKIQDRNLDGRQNIDEIVTEGKIDANQSKLDYVKDSNLQKQSQKSELEKLKANDSARKESGVKQSKK